MATAKKKLLISLMSAKVDTLDKSKQSSHLLTAELIWPRNAIAKKTSMVACKLSNGVFTQDSAPWGERVLFKEETEGRFGLKVVLSKPTDSAALEAFLRSIFGTLLSAGGEFLASSTPVAPVRKIERAPFEYFSKLIAKMPDPNPLAYGIIDLSPKDIQNCDDISIPIRLSEAVWKTTQRPGKGQHPIRKKVMEKDTEIGAITLKVEVL